MSGIVDSRSGTAILSSQPIAGVRDEIVFTPSAVYPKGGAQTSWVKLPVPGAPGNRSSANGSPAKALPPQQLVVELLDPLVLLAEAESANQPIRDLGSAQVAGQAAIRYSFAVAVDRVPGVAGSAGKAVLKLVPQVSGPANPQGQAWVSRSGRLVRIAIVTQAGHAGASASVSVAMTVTGLVAHPNVPVPPASQVVAFPPPTAKGSPARPAG